MKIVSLGLISALLLSACAAPSQIMMRSDGASVRCSAIGGGVIGVTAAIISKNGCVSDYRDMGYVTLEEYNAAKAAGTLSTITKPAATHTNAAPTGPVASLGKADIKLTGDWIRKPPSDDFAKKGIVVHATNPNIDAGLLLSARSKTDISDVNKFVESKVSAMSDTMTNAKTTQIAALLINGNQAVQAEVVGTSKNGIRMHYQTTTILYGTQLITLVAWASESNFTSNEKTISGLPSLVTSLD